VTKEGVVMSTIAVNGVKLRNLLAEHSVKQKELSKAVGVSHYNVSRWCGMGVHQLKRKNVLAVAEFLQMTFDDLLSVIAEGLRVTECDLSPAEREWVALYRSLKPIEQAQVLLQVEKFVKDSNPNQSSTSQGSRS
jgi:transcriptional regulator with XRE-family HTH domain